MRKDAITLQCFYNFGSTAHSVVPLPDSFLSTKKRAMVRPGWAASMPASKPPPPPPQGRARPTILPPHPLDPRPLSIPQATSRLPPRPGRAAARLSASGSRGIERRFMWAGAGQAGVASCPWPPCIVEGWMVCYGRRKIRQVHLPHVLLLLRAREQATRLQLFNEFGIIILQSWQMMGSSKESKLENVLCRIIC